jgi:capsular polysaccharide biosynthesis protein
VITRTKLFGRPVAPAMLFVIALAVIGSIAGAILSALLPTRYETRQTYVVSVDGGVDQTVAASTQLIEQRARTYAGIAATGSFKAELLEQVSVHPSLVELEASYVGGTALFEVLVRSSEKVAAEEVQDAIATSLRTSDELGVQVATTVQEVAAPVPAVRVSHLRDLVPLGALAGLVIGVALLVVSERRTSAA